MVRQDLEYAVLLALSVHGAQRDKGGRPYILHPLRVMVEMDRQGRPDEYLIAAVLHDIVEDGNVSTGRIAELYGPVVGAAVDNLTRNPDEEYAAYIERAGSGPISRAVKLADLQDNMRVERLPSIGIEEIERLRKYARALRYLKGLRA